LPGRPGRRDSDELRLNTVRWLLRLLEEDESLTIDEATMAASCLAALGGSSHEEAVGMLLAMAERATRQRAARQIAS